MIPYAVNRNVRPNVVWYGYGGESLDNAIRQGLALGPELLTDGDMEAAGTAAWGSTGLTLTKDTTIKYSGAQSMKCAKSAAGTGSLYSNDTITIGKVYCISGQVKSDGTSKGRISQLGVSAFDSTTGGSWESFSVDVVATVVQPLFQTVDGTTGNFVHWDNISIKEVVAY
jgi:hypothetical protein